MMKIGLAVILAILNVLLAAPTLAYPGESYDLTRGERQFLYIVTQLGYPVAEDGWRTTLNNGTRVCGAAGQAGEFSTDERWQMGQNSVLLMYAHNGPITIVERERAHKFASAAVTWLCTTEVQYLML